MTGVSDCTEPTDYGPDQCICIVYYVLWEVCLELTEKGPARDGEERRKRLLP